MEESGVMISVIIATRDRAPLLASTLEALVTQQWPGRPFEILVVDNASVDHTEAVVKTTAQRTTVPVIYLREERAGKSHALNTALAHARGDLLVFTDDDVLPAPEWLVSYVRAFEETGADYAAGRILPLWETPPPRWMSPALHGVLAITDGGTERLPLGRGVNVQIMPIGANMAVRRHVVDRIGGWNPSLGKLQGTLRTGEDHEFALRMTAAGLAGVYEPTAVVQHRVPADRLEKTYFQRWFYDNGIIVAGLEEHYPTTDHYLLHTPRYLWREALVHAWSTLRAFFARDAKRMTAGTMRLLWFVGYVKARWASRRTPQVPHEPGASTDARARSRTV
jgi:glucosyl-dolichyl phosphate glucuronosyltransferase